MVGRYLSRLHLSQSPQVQALSALLDPAHEGQRRDAQHRLIWSAFGADPDARRDFLWRDEGQGRFLVLSDRRPEGGPLFDPPEIRDFAPDLRAGDRLQFALRVNATRTMRDDQGRKQHVDIVMDALHAVPKGQRAPVRMQVAQQAASDWMAGQGARHGFAPDGVAVDDYIVSAIPGHKGPRLRQPRFGILELTGQITVTDPAALLARIGAGFGRAKAFGCGLMLIRRA